MLVEGFSGQPKRRDNRDIRLRQFRGEVVLFLDTGIRPTPGAIKLHHHRRFVLEANLVDTIFVTIQREHAPVGHQPYAFERGPHEIRRQTLVRNFDRCARVWV